MTKPVGFQPNVWAEAILRGFNESSRLMEMIYRPDPYLRRGHYVRLPHWVRRWLPRRGWVWDESKTAHAARVSELPPKPEFVRFSVVSRKPTNNRPEDG